MAKQIQTRIVLRNDSTANWNSAQSVVLLKGEVGLEYFADGSVGMKIGDGVKTWSQLDYFTPGKTEGTKFFEVIAGDDKEDIDALLSVIDDDVELINGDIGIVKRLIAGDNYQHTAYVYSDGTWKALDGNYNAENVYFDKDLLTTSAIGNITLSNGQATISAAGKNLKQVFDTIFVKEQNPTATQPSVSVTFSQAKAYEVGTAVSPTYTATLSTGSYTYGPATGITATSWSVSDTDGNTATTNSGSFPSFIVSDGKTYKITATATYEDGTVPLTNTGNKYPNAQIKAGSKTGSSGSVTGYRNSFYGSVNDKGELTSSVIRGLSGKSGKALANGNSFTVSIPVGAMRVVIAYPAGLRDLTSITDTNGLGAQIVSGFTKQVISVEGANGYDAVDYKVFTMDFANANDKANTYNVTI